MSVQQEKFKAIADKIRKNTNSAKSIKPSAFAEKVDEVYKAGKQAEYDAFWDAFQENGNRSTYNYAFTGWADAYYNPKYPLVLKSDVSIGNAFNSTKITNTKVPITTSGQTLITLFANSLHLITIPYLDVSGITKLIDRCFNSVSRLENLTMVGTINANGFDVHWSNALTHDSLMSILNALADKTTDTSGTEWVCTLGTTNLDKLTATEIAVATEKGWTLA